MYYKNIKRSFIGKTLLMILVLIAFSILLSGVSDFFVIKKMETEIRKKESCRIKRAFPSLLHLCEEKIGNMLNSFGMWDEMVQSVREKNVDWIKEMMDDDEMVTSQFDSYGVYNLKGVPIYLKNRIFSDGEVSKIMSFIDKNFKVGKIAHPVTFFHKWDGKIYHVGILPLCWNNGKVASQGFIYFAHRIGKNSLKTYSQILSSKVEIDVGRLNGTGSGNLIFTFPMKDIDGTIIGNFKFFEDMLIIRIFQKMNKTFIFVMIILVICYAGAFLFVSTSINRAIKETFGNITGALKRLSEGDFGALEKLDKFCLRKDELGNLTRNIQKIAEQLSVNLSTDPLTGIYNRLYFSKKFEEEIERAKRMKRPLSFVIFDLDDFKKINDTYGHVAGDLVLKSFAKAVSSSVRSLDTFARIGGEEFGLILPETDVKTAVRVVNRIKERFKNVYIPEIGKKVKITFSAGVAGYREGDNMDALFHRADVALYRAKENGKDRVEIEEE
ncbi:MULTISPECIES: sensor domain-containing diguanylate cyclase [unclassified Desulfurobacterium]|uniref:sensor domain-containing diguanylate cyclase n=1 Tax=Desulfurobacterium sp. TC5-1 TaxID=1158318 RepID=UPI0003B560EC|nr:diguanylate cyclase [Desulfurobacterium sp. TC5-1]